MHILEMLSSVLPFVFVSVECNRKKAKVFFSSCSIEVSEHNIDVNLRVCDQDKFQLICFYREIKR